jgi:transposase-like protein
VYLWADGIYVNVRAEERCCVLVVVGCDVHGNKHFLAIEDGFRESAASWNYPFRWIPNMFRLIARAPVDGTTEGGAV